MRTRNFWNRAKRYFAPVNTQTNPFLTTPNGLFVFDSILQTGLSNGASVASVTNQYPGATLTTNQGTAGQRPTWQTSAFSSAYPVLRFDGVDDNLPLSGNIVTGNSSVSIYLVYQPKGATSGGPVFGFGTSGANALLAPGTADNNIAVFKGVDDMYMGTAALTDQPRLVHCVRYQAGSPGTLYSNTFGGRTIADTRSITAAFGSGAGIIGLPQVGSTFYGQNDVAMIAVYSGFHSDATMLDLMDYALFRFFYP